MLAITVLFALVLVTVGQNPYKDPHYVEGRDTMVHLFEWKWKDIAKECEDFLGPMGYGGVQVSPIQENVIVKNRPWWERYQPISYLSKTRSGTKLEFHDMVARCSMAGVRIYVDVVFNHMSADYSQAVGTGGSKANTHNLEYDGVPYNAKDFHSRCKVNNYEDATNVRNCELNGLHDLNQTTQYVRDRIVEFMNEVIDAGVAGFRIDSAKHMWPADLKVIYSRLNNLNENFGFPPYARPFIYQQIIDYDGKQAVSKYEYNGMGVVTEYKHGAELSNSFGSNNLLKWFSNWGEKWQLLPSSDALVFVDNHDTQRATRYRVLNYKSAKSYKMAVAFMLAQPYGIPRLMSSFDFENYDQGPPMDSQEHIKSPNIHPDNTCGAGWICEHRWRQIYNMVRFRNTVARTNVTDWWDNDSNQIAFCRENAGFVAFNGDEKDMKVTINGCLLPGRYCDLISGNLESGRCTGKVITVQQNNAVYVEILTSDEDGVIAIDKNTKVA